MGIYSSIRRMRYELGLIIKQTCKHDSTGSFKISQHSENKSGYDIIKIDYCENCKSHLNKEVVGFVPYNGG